MEQWEKIADEYGLNLLAQKYILWPNLTQKLKEIFKNSNLLDVGCGNGSYANFFNTNGCQIVTGIDSSKAQIKLAKENNKGPHYECTLVQDFNSDFKFVNILANMVICNIENEEKMALFFKKIKEISVQNANLYVTNVSSEFQNSCNTFPLIHNYPTIVHEGVSFEVSLRNTDNEFIGPFKNYHWSIEKLKSISQLHGWYLEKEEVLIPQGNINTLNWPTYSLYKFKKLQV